MHHALCGGSKDGSDRNGSIVCNLTLHFFKEFFLYLGVRNGKLGLNKI